LEHLGEKIQHIHWRIGAAFGWRTWAFDFFDIARCREVGWGVLSLGKTPSGLDLASSSKSSLKNWPKIMPNRLNGSESSRHDIFSVQT